MKLEHWTDNKWRPMMGWMYMATCITDFIIFPVLWSILQAYSNGQVTSQWDPLTLKGAGLFHVAMGAILGVTAWSRGQEKMAGAITTTAPAQFGVSNTPQPVVAERAAPVTKPAFTATKVPQQDQGEL